MRKKLGLSTLSTLSLIVVGVIAAPALFQFGHAGHALIGGKTVSSGTPALPSIGSRREASIAKAAHVLVQATDATPDLVDAMADSRWVTPVALKKIAEEAEDPAQPMFEFGAGPNRLHDFAWTDLPIDRVHPTHVRPAFERAAEEAQSLLDGITQVEGVRTWENTIAPYDAAYKKVKDRSLYFANLRGLGALSDELSKAYDDAYPIIGDFYDRNALHEDLYKAMLEFRQSTSFVAASDTQKRYVNKIIESYERSGVDRTPEVRSRLLELDNELEKLSEDFQKNANEARDSFGIVIARDADMTGIPPYLVERGAERGARMNEEGSLFVETEARTIMRTAQASDLREEVWRSLETKTARGDYDNREIVRKILTLRREKANLLGYDSFVDYQLVTRMAEDGQTAVKFIEGLRDDVAAHYRRSGRKLRAFRRSQGETGDMNPWDEDYWTRRYALLQDDASTDLRPYLEFNNTTRGVLNVYEKMYNIKISEVPGARVWDSSVKLYKVEDSDGTHLGSFYYDPFSRPGKDSGAWHQGLETGANRDPNVSVVATNINGADADGPLLMSLAETRTQFHEFGHLMQAMFSQVDVPSLGGTSVARDAVEFPSTLMEYWRFETEVIPMFMKHYKTGAPPPQAVIDEVIGSRNQQVVDNLMYQLQLSLVDLALHRDFEPSVHGDDALAFARQVSQRYTDRPLPHGYAQIASFAHIFSGGYAAGYYSYLWSSVLAADAFFTQFKPAGVLNREVADRFRHFFLRVGSSVDESEAYRNFAGHDPDPRWLLRSMGLEKESYAKRTAGTAQSAYQSVRRNLRRAVSAVGEEWRVYRRLR